MARKTHETKATLSNNLEPESLYNPGHNRGTDVKEENVLIDSNHDLSKTALETEADYVNRLTSGDIAHQGSGNGHRSIRKGNAFRISDQIEFSPIGMQPLTHTIPVENAAGELKHRGATLGNFLDVTRQFNSTQANRFEQTSMGTYGKGENPFLGDDPVIDKTLATDGHVLLPSIKTKNKRGKVGNPAIYSDDDIENVVKAQKRISAVLKTNRFNPSNNTPFMRDNQRIRNANNQIQMGYTKQSELGEYQSNTGFVLERHLKSVADDLMARASGYSDMSEIVDEDGNVDLLNLPNIAGLTGWKTIKAGDLRASRTEVGRKIIPAEAGVNTSLLAGEGSEDSRLSYGSLNNSAEHFAGPMPVSMIINTLIGLAGLVIASATVSLMVTPFRSDEEDIGILPRHTMPTDMAMGQHGLAANVTSDGILKMFRIPKVEHDFDLCMLAGILAFYGLEELPALMSDDVRVADLLNAAQNGPVLNIFDKFANIALSAGYYTVITRAVVRDTEQITAAISGLNPAHQGIGGSIVQTFKIIDSIVESTTYKFLMTMAAIGDKILSSIDGHPTLSPTPDMKPNGLPENATNRIKMSRVDSRSPGNSVGSTKEGRMAWRHASAPARYILPASFARSVKNLAETGINTVGSDESMLSNLLLNRMYRQFTLGGDEYPIQDSSQASELGDGTGWDILGSNQAQTPGKLPKDYTKWIENKLEAEYMPFYFHDLRTNEIISFHAFLADLTDSYAVDYTSTSGYGRGDDIKIYNKTTRSISLKFHVVATSDSDMDVMYWHINKLVSMVYPQWSRGRAVINGTGVNAQKFVQPFSQIPTASPMIRLRFGDMLTSNYSKFGLMRLFGLGEKPDVFNLNYEEVIIPDEIEVDSEIDKQNLLMRALKQTDPGGTDAEQVKQLKSFGITDLSGIDITGGDSIFGYQPGDMVILDCNVGDGYWGRDNTGKLAKQLGKKIPKNNPAWKLHKYPKDVEAKIIMRVPDAVNPKKQNEINFAAHVDGATPYTPESEKAEADKPGIFYRQMAYLLEIQPGSEADINLGPDWPNEMKHHRALHHMIKGLSEKSEKKKKVQPPPPPRDVVNPHLLSEWFDSKNNYLVRSFESSMGRGLAGFITNLSFDWAEATWETIPGKRAPKSMIVNIDFAPIHDIPMGLDSEGMMRSVPYNVGLPSHIIGQDPLNVSRADLDREVMSAAAAGSLVGNSRESKIKNAAQAALEARDNNSTGEVSPADEIAKEAEKQASDLLNDLMS